MTVFLSLCFLFVVGSLLGWIIEVLFRRFVSAKKWINPGFLTGPYLPLYGFGLAGLCLICLIPIDTGISWLNAVLIILIMGVAMTVIEYIAGIIFIKGMHIKLWDYSDRWGNIQGIICPLFSLFWTIIGAAYYFVINPYVMEWVNWFVNNIYFAFFVGIVFGIMIVDFGHSMHLATRIKEFAANAKVVVSFEKLKESIKEQIDKRQDGQRSHFWLSFRSSRPLSDHLQSFVEEQQKKDEP